MDVIDQPGTIPVSALSGRPSRSADAARLAQIRAELVLTPRERMLLALDGGVSGLQEGFGFDKRSAK